jgi:flagellar basal-body rod protein FlgF
MDPITIAAAAGLRSRMESLSMMANNLANAATAGFKADREFYSLYTSSEAEGEAEGNVATLPSIERQWTDFGEGTIQSTASPLDIAISGRGFLTVDGPTGPTYTRNGSLKVLPTGELATSDGFAVKSTEGKTIKVAGNRPVDILTDGTIQQDGITLGQIAVVDFKSLESLEKVSGTHFRNTDPKNKPQAAKGVEVLQGKLEGSNVVVPEAAMRLVGVMRQFEMLQKAVSMGIEMNSKAIQEVARVGP